MYRPKKTNRERERERSLWSVVKKIYEVTSEHYIGYNMHSMWKNLILVVHWLNLSLMGINFACVRIVMCSEG